ncbi:MAG: 50S ribosomal protein L31e [Candidatus Woesearchaeota archaeon]
MVIERTYNVPLRREFLKAPKYKRAKTAIIALKKFLQRHMKSSEIYIGKRLNEKIWERGIKNPPHHIKVDVVKEEDGKVYAELSGFKYEKPIVAEEKQKKTKEEKTEEKKEDVKEKDVISKLENKTKQIKEKKEKDAEQKEKIIEQLEKKEEKIEKEKKKQTSKKEQKFLKDEKKPKQRPAS